MLNAARREDGAEAGRLGLIAVRPSHESVFTSVGWEPALVLI